MKVELLLDDVEQLTQDGLTRTVPVARPMLLSWLSAELNELTGREEWDWAMRHLDPLVSTTTARRTYQLPENFPDNFVRHAGDRGEKWCCKLDNGSNEVPLAYESPVQFYSTNLRAESNGTPSKYTVVSAATGGRQIVLSPPPDANGSTGFYTIDGLYIPTDWGLHDEDDLPPMPGNSMVLKYAVLRRLDRQTYEPMYREALALLALRSARQRGAQFVPRYGTAEYFSRRVASR